MKNLNRYRKNSLPSRAEVGEQVIQQKKRLRQERRDMEVPHLRSIVKNITMGKCVILLPKNLKHGGSILMIDLYW